MSAPEGPAIDPNEPEVQFRIALAACIAQELQAGRTREEAAAICRQLLKEQSESPGNEELPGTVQERSSRGTPSPLRGRPAPCAKHTLAEALQELVVYIAKSLVTYPDKVSVIAEEGEEGVFLKLDTSPEDKGRVIGKQGRVAQAMRTLLRVKAAREETGVRLEIL